MQSLEPFQASLLFRAIKFHFTQDKYDFVKYHGKVSGDTIANKQKFMADKSRYHYSRLGKHADPEGLLVANFIKNPKSYIIDIVNDEGQRVYDDWVSRKASRYYNLECELKTFDSIKQLMNVSNLPPIIEKYISDEISPESIVLIDSVTHILSKMDERAHPLLEHHHLKLRKYSSFIDINIGKVKTIFEKVF